jgi:hypothetical protein
MVMKLFASYPPGRVVHLTDISSDIHDDDGRVNRRAKIKLKPISAKTLELPRNGNRKPIRGLPRGNLLIAKSCNVSHATG